MEHYVFISHNSKDAHIANAIVHHLEASGIRCWIAPRDIGQSDWADAIMNGIKQCDVFVVIISHNSIESSEVTKEVTQATRHCQYILPFKIDGEMLNQRLDYHLSPCHWLDAINPPLEDHIEKLKQRILHLEEIDEIYVNHKCRRIVSNIPRNRTIFVGREEEIEELHSLLQEDNVVFLQGMGGIGKSEIAKGYAKKYEKEYDSVIFMNYRGSIIDMVSGDDLQITNFVRTMNFGEDAESSYDFFKRKLNTLKELSDEKVLLIVDNFDVEEDENMYDLIEGPYKIIFTTRYEHSDYATLLIEKIKDFSNVRYIFEKNYGKKISEKDSAMIDEILHLVNCHTITVELIAKQMKVSHKTPEKMLSLLKEGGVNTKLKEKVKREGLGNARSSFDFIRDLFTLSNLSEKEKEIMKLMCMLPFSGMDISWFAELLNLEDFDVLNSLIAKSWIILDEESDYVKIHPIIYDVVKEELKPDPVSCYDYIHALWKDVRGMWNFDLEDRDQKWPYVDFLLQKYPNPVKELWYEYASFLNIAWICGRFEQSIKAGHKHYDFTMKEYGQHTLQAAFSARWLAGTYYNAGDFDTAEIYYKEALEHHKHSVEKDYTEYGLIYGKVGRCAYMHKDFEESKRCLDKALELLQISLEVENNETTNAEIGNIYVEMQRMYIEMEEYDLALEYCQKSYDIIYSRFNKEITNCVYSLTDMGICYSRLKQFEKADYYLQRALDLNIRINGEASLVTERSKEAICENELNKGNIEKAKQLYLQLELELEKYFGNDNPEVIRIHNIYESL